MLIKFSMNAIFTVFFIISAIALVFINPDKVLSSMLSGGEKALGLSIKLTAVYAVWLGIFNIFEKTGFTAKFAKILKPFNKAVFGDLTEKENEYISLNISANALGMTGATTPMGIKAIEELEKRTGTRSKILTFFVINATSIQIIPTTVIALRTSLSSLSPSDVILPTIISTLVSTVSGILLCKMFLFKDKNKVFAANNQKSNAKILFRHKNKNAAETIKGKTL